MNKKASKILSVYWFLMLTIVAGGIVAMVTIFYGSPYDVRVAESEILSMKVANCLVFEGEMNPLLITKEGVVKEEFKDNFLERCNLNFDVRNEFESPQYYVQVEFFYGANSNKPKFTLLGGNKNFVADCNLNDPEEEKLVKCSEKYFFTRDDLGNLYLVKILSVVGNLDKNVK